MKLLAFDTSTERLTVAVQHGEHVVLRTAAGAAQASANLIPTLLAALAEADLALDLLDAVILGRGPGSFTGVRTACSVAQGLAFGARGGRGIPVLPIDTLLAVAEDARHRHGCTHVVAVLDARMDEAYCAPFTFDAGAWSGSGDFSVCAPEAVVVPDGYTVAGNAQAIYGARLVPQATHVHALPEAAALLRLAPSLLARGMACAPAAALPLYVRDKVAYTTDERAVRNAARDAALLAAKEAP